MKEIMLVVVIIAFAAAGFMFTRWVNYNMPFGYEDKVEETINERVKSLEMRIEKLERMQR